MSKADFVPRSEAKGAWVSLTAAGTCAAFEVAAGSYEPPMLALAGELSALLADAAVWICSACGTCSTTAGAARNRE